MNKQNETISYKQQKGVCNTPPFYFSTYTCIG